MLTTECNEMQWLALLQSPPVEFAEEERFKRFFVLYNEKPVAKHY